MATKGQLAVLVTVSLLYCTWQVAAICENTADTFYCYTTNTRISCSKWRDGVYTDCGGTDYSDEVHTKACTVPYSTSGGTFNCENNGGQTVACTKYMDGTDDCSATADSNLNGADEFCRLQSNYASSTATLNSYPCRNGTRISCYLFQDGKNDCGDNSDEGVLYNCPLKSSFTEHNFKCTLRDQINDYSVGICQAPNFKFDGGGDCSDKSDEALLIGGDACASRTTGVQCADIIPGSHCDSTNDHCLCDTGKMSVWSGSMCLGRIVDDPCSTSTDCSGSMTGLDCNTGTNICYCTVGYYVYNPAGNTIRDKDTICQANKLYEACTINEECSNVITHAECTTNLCLCNTDYLPELTTNATCKSRVIDDTCDTTAQCNIGMQNAECGLRNSTDTQTVCICHVGAYENSDKTNCIQRVIDESCTSDDMCSLSPNTTCTTSSGSSTCQCKTPDTGVAWVVSYDKAMCAYGLGDLKCLSDENCTVHFANAACSSSICLCADTYYEDGYKTCTQFAIGSPNCGENDCSHIPNAECDAFKTCQCLTDYNAENGACIYVGASTGCNFACQYPYVIVILVLAILGLIVVIVLIAYKRPWKQEKDEKKPPAGSVAPYSNGGPTYDQEKEKPVWTLRPKSSNKPMYEHMHLQAPCDPEVDSFFSGGRKKKKVGQLPPIEDEEQNIFIFKGQHEKTPRGRKSPDKSNVHDDGYHTCGYNIEDGTKCQFSTDSYYRMRMHKKETSHFIRDSYLSKKGKKRKPSLTKRRKSKDERTPASLGNIEEEVGHIYTSEEEDDATLVALNEAGVRTSSYDDQQQYLNPEYGQSSRANGIGRHIALAFASMEEPMETEDTSNLISDDENEGRTRVVNVYPQDLNGRPFTPEPTGVMSPGDISVSNVNAENSPVMPLETSGISEVAKANSQTDQPPDDEDEDSSSDDEEEAGGDGKGGKAGTKKGKSGKGKKGKGGKGKKEKGKKGKKDGDGKKGKKGDKKGSKKEKAGGKKGKGKKNKNNNNRNCDDSDFDEASENGCAVFSLMSEGSFAKSANGRRISQPPAVPILVKDRSKVQSGRDSDPSDVESLTDGVFAMSCDVDPMQFSRRSIISDRPNLHRPMSRCESRSPVDSVTIPMPATRLKKQVSFSKTHVHQELQDFSDHEEKPRFQRY